MPDVQDDIAAAEKLVAHARIAQRSNRFGNPNDISPDQELSEAMVDLLVIGIKSLARIADGIERHNEAVAQIAARRYNLDSL